ncbi:hypothetical protein UlMin_018804 [Ulmus minor]
MQPRGITMIRPREEKESAACQNKSTTHFTKISNLQIGTCGTLPKQVVTNGTYHSIEHRVMVNGKKERLLVATFLTPRLDGEFGTAPSLIMAETLALLRRIGATDYFKGYYSRELVIKSYVDVMRINNKNEEENGSKV